MALNILIVSQHFYPDNFRINEIAKMLAEEGHRVTVLTSLPDYETGKVPAGCKGLKNRKFVWNGVNVIRCFSVSRRNGIFFRALNYASFCLTSTGKALNLRGDYDVAVCYQTSPVLMANAARAFAKKGALPFFIYCLDLWPESLKAWNISEKNPLFKVMSKYSKSIYNSADCIGVTSKPFIEYLCKVNGVPENKIVYIPQHSDDMNLKPKMRNKGEPFVFSFGGNIGSVQNVECIIKAASIISGRDDIKIEIYGDGSELQKCKELSEKLHTDKIITFYGRIPKEELWKRYENTDVFLLTLKQQGVIGQTVPAKLQEYMSGNRPIIAAVSGAAEQIIEESGCGICVPADDSEALAKAIADYADNSEKYAVCADRGREYYVNNFTGKSFIDSLTRALNGIIGSSEGNK